MGAVKISKGIYEYKGYRISNCGYYEPDHCIWWEAVDMKWDVLIITQLQRSF